MRKSDVEILTEFITSSGGPSLNADNIQGIKDLDAGRLLLEWLSSQLSVYKAEDDPDSSENVADIARHRRVATQDFTLEVDEVKMLSDVRVSEAMAEHPNPTQHDGNYVPPSHLKKHAELINSETSNVQREVDFLRSRISQTKGASKKLSSSIKVLQRAVHEMDVKVRILEEGLTELSITGSTTISDTIKRSQELLLDLRSAEALRSYNHVSDVTEKDAQSATDNTQPFPKECALLEEIRYLLLGSRRNLTALTTELQEWTNNLETLNQEETEKAVDLRTETQRLQASFNKEISDLTLQSPVLRRDESGAKLNKDVTEELEHICYTLEQEVALRDLGNTSGSNSLDHLLSELHDAYLGDKRDVTDQPVNPIVQNILRNAWMMDQIEILKMHTDTLAEAISCINSILSPLEEMHQTLAKLVRCVQESEATLEAFVEELEDIAFNATQDERGQNTTHTAIDDEAEQRIKEALNDYEDPSPLLLFTREDVIEELRSLKARSTRVEGSERLWSSNILQQYSRPVHQALPRVYANAPLNSSPPFSSPYLVRELEAHARKRAAELQNLASSVEEEVRETFSSESNLRRLEAFIEKWCEDGGA